MFLAGVLLLVIAMPTGNTKSEKKQENTSKEETKGAIATETNLDATALTYQTQLETQLEAILSSMEGVGAVDVMITLKNNGESLVEKDKESMSESTKDVSNDSQSVKQEVKETTIYEDQTEEGGPFVRMETYPEIAGVLVVCQGGDEPRVVENISSGVQALFHLEIHKIKIVKMQTQSQEGTN